LPLGHALLEQAVTGGDAGNVLEVAEQRRRRLPVLRARGVVRHADLHRDRGVVTGVELGLQRADDAGDPLVARPVEPEALRELGVGRGCVHEWHPAVRDLRRHRAEGDHHLRPGVLGHLHQEPGEPTPVVVRLDAGHQHELPTGVRLVVGVHRVLRPHDRPGDAVLEHHVGTHLLGVEERVTVDGREPGRVGELDEVVDGAGGRGRRVEVPGERHHEDRRPTRPLPLPFELAHRCSLSRPGPEVAPAPGRVRRPGSVTGMNATILVLGLAVAVAAAVRSTWSPCGQSMLSQLTPVGEASRGDRYRTTAAWFVTGALVGGATLGGVMAVLAAAVAAIGASATALLGTAAGLSVLAAAVNAGVLGFAPPFCKRQVNEYWLGRYRAWVYGSGFGWQIGTGVTTYIMTAAVFLAAALGALTGGPV